MLQHVFLLSGLSTAFSDKISRDGRLSTGWLSGRPANCKSSCNLVVIKHRQSSGGKNSTSCCHGCWSKYFRKMWENLQQICTRLVYSAVHHSSTKADYPQHFSFNHVAIDRLLCSSLPANCRSKSRLKKAEDNPLKWVAEVKLLLL